MPTQYNAYTDGTITIIGTCLADAILAYAQENPDFIYSTSTATWRMLDDRNVSTVRNGDSEYRSTLREQIQVHVSRKPDGFSRLLMSRAT